MPIGKNSIARAAKITAVSENASAEPKSAPAVTEHVIANISPEVVEKVTGIKEEQADAPKTTIVQILSPMPDHLL